MESVKSITSISNYLEKSKRDIVKKPSGILKFPYITPGGLYDQLWDWDSFFIGVVLSDGGNAEPLKHSVMNFLDFIEEDGHTPWVINPEIYPNRRQKGKPFLAQSSLIASFSFRDFKWINNTYSDLKKSIEYWDIYRKNSNGLCVWMDGYESGSDNNPATLWPAFTVEGVDLNCFLYREYRAFSIISEKLEKFDIQRIYNMKANSLKEVINEKMWSTVDSSYYNLLSEGGTYTNYNDKSENRIQTNTWTNFLPMWLGITPKDKANRAIEKYLLNTEEFLGPFGLRSISKQEPYFNQESTITPYSNYQGPVWIHVNYLLIHGLNNYGYTKEALEIVSTINNLLVKDIKKTGTTHEFYNSETGEGLGATNFTGWNILFENIQEEILQNNDPLNPDLRDF